MGYMKRHMDEVARTVRAALDADSDEDAMRIVRGLSWADIRTFLDNGQEAGE